MKWEQTAPIRVLKLEAWRSPKQTPVDTRVFLWIPPVTSQTWHLRHHNVKSRMTILEDKRDRLEIAAQRLSIWPSY